MSTTSQQYAGLAEKSYSDEYRPGIYPPDEAPGFSYEGIEYKVLEHTSNARNGYQGMIFQRVDTGEIIVAHRGTEEIIKDGAQLETAEANLAELTSQAHAFLIRLPILKALMVA